MMKRRIFALALVLALCAALPLSVRADVIYMPQDSFFEDHLGACNYVNRSYIANGIGGAVTIYRSPEDSMVVTTVENGQMLYVSYVYTGPDGTEWGCWEDFDAGLLGWVPMAYAVPVYNNQSFEEEFGHRFLDEEGNLDALGGQVIKAWSYPGSDRSSDLTIDPEYGPDYWTVFIDDAGQKWGYCGYYFGHRDFWVCLDDPTADYETLYANHAPQQVTIPEITEPTEEIKPGGISPTLAIGAAAAVAAVSGVLLVMLKKKKQES